MMYLSSNQNKLRDFIRQIRQCKTSKEERQLVNKEKANIRNQISKNQIEHRLRNIAKLLFINMMGYDTDFGQNDVLMLLTQN